MQKDGERIMDVRLARVTNVGEDGQATVTFYGDNTPSAKKYPYIRNFMPEKDDTVVMLKQGNTYVIMGAVVTGEMVLQFARTDHDHAETYAEKKHEHTELINQEKGVQLTEAGELVPKKGTETLGTEAKVFAAVYGTTVVAIDKVTIGEIDVTEELLEELQRQTVLYSDTYANRNISFKESALLPDENGTVSFGSSTKKYKEGHFNTVYIGGTAVNATFLTGLQSELQSSTSSVRKVSFSGAEILPDTGEVISLGSSGKSFKDGYFKTLYVGGTTVTAALLAALQSPSTLQSSTVATRKVNFTGSALLPDITGAISLGNSSKKYKEGHFDNVYINGTAVSTSDKRKKKFIKNLPEKYVEFFRKLRPVIFKYKNGTSGRYHAGFIAQEVEKAMIEGGVTPEEFGGLVVQTDGKYGLRYEEFVAIQTKMIQELYEKVENLERTVRELDARN